MKKLEQDEIDNLVNVYARETLDLFEKASRNPKLAKEITAGCFSKAEFRWINSETKRLAEMGYEEYINAPQAGSRQSKNRVKRRIAMATMTLFLASYLGPAYADEEWEEILPVGVLGAIVYMSALRGGDANSMILVDAINKGLNENLEVTTGGLLKGQVSLSLVPSQEKLVKFETRIGERIVEMMKEDLKE